MNILVLTSQFFAPGGAEGLQIEFALELASRSGVSVTLMSLGDPEDDKVLDAKHRLEAKGLRVVVLNLPLHPSLPRLFYVAKTLRAWIIRERVDVVETALFTPSIVAALATRGLRIPIVHGVHAPFYRDMKLGALNLRKYFWRWCLNRRNVFYYSISNFVGLCWQDFFRVPPARICRIYNSIADRHFGSVSDREVLFKSVGIEPSEKLILFVGRIRPDKGVELLLDAVQPELFRLRAHLVLIGDVEPDFATLGERINEVSRGLHNRVHHLGYRNDVAMWLASADVFVLPTQREGFGMAVLEALAAGCPTVTTTVDALPEVFAESGAVLVPPQDKGALVEAISTALSLDLHQRQDLADVTRSFAAGFNTKKRTNQLLEYMRKCMTSDFC